MEVTAQITVRIPEGIPTEAVMEWLEFHLGASDGMKMSNPLEPLELRDCVVSIDDVEIPETYGMPEELEQKGGA